jgi:LuxR family transcriptional regulator, maltose regulon positive regulatory protein
MTGLNRDGAAMFRWSADRLRESSDEPDEERQRMLALLLAFEGQCRIPIAYEDARQLAQDSITMMRSLPTTKETLHAILIATTLAASEAERTQLFEEALNIARANHYGCWIAKLTIDLAEQAMGAGDLEQAERLLQEAFAICHETNDPTQTVHALLGWSGLAYNHHDYARAQQRAQDALALAQEIDYTSGILWSTAAAADHALLQGDYATAYACSQTTVKLSQEQEDRVGCAFQMRRLGSAAWGLGHYEEARRNFYDGLQTAVDAGHQAATLDVLGETAWLLHGRGQTGQAAELAGFVLNHPASLDIIKRRLTSLLTELEGVLPMEGLGTAVARGKTLDFDKTVQELLAELGRPLPDTGRVGELPTPQPAVDPLTERELEVLQLIAEGLSNYDIAVRLFVGVSTVKTHANRIFGKLGVKSRTQAAAHARERLLL